MYISFSLVASNQPFWQDLAEIIKNDRNKPGTDYLVVDVRDDDFVGGNIKGAKNVPSENFTKGLSELVKETRDIPKVVFHCTYSQIRWVFCSFVSS